MGRKMSVPLHDVDGETPAQAWIKQAHKDPSILQVPSQKLGLDYLPKSWITNIRGLLAQCDASIKIARCGILALCQVYQQTSSK